MSTRESGELGISLLVFLCAKEELGLHEWWMDPRSGLWDTQNIARRGTAAHTGMCQRRCAHVLLLLCPGGFIQDGDLHSCLGLCPEAQNFLGCPTLFYTFMSMNGIPLMRYPRAMHNLDT